MESTNEGSTSDAYSGAQDNRRVSSLTADRTTREAFRRARAQQREILCDLPPVEAERMRWRWDVERLGVAARAIKHYVRRSEATTRSLLGELGRLGPGERAELWREVDRRNQALLEGMPDSLYDPAHRALLPMPAVEIARHGRSCPNEELKTGLLRLEWGDPKLSYEEYASVADHHALCLDCCHEFLLFGWHGMYNAAQQELGRRDAFRLLRNAITAEQRDR